MIFTAKDAIVVYDVVEFLEALALRDDIEFPFCFDFDAKLEKICNIKTLFTLDEKRSKFTAAMGHIFRLCTLGRLF